MEISRMSPLITTGNHSISYSVGGVTNCCLESESDLNGLVQFCKISGEKLANISVSIGNEICVSSSTVGDVVETSDGIHMNQVKNKLLGKKAQTCLNAETSIDSIPILNDVSGNDFEGIGSIPIFEVYQIEKKKTYLSDHWAKIMEGGVGSTFPGGAREFRIELKKYAMKLNFQFKYKKNTPKYIYVICSQKESAGCEWFIKAKQLPMNSGFVISKGEFVHNCVGKLIPNSKNSLGKKIIKELVMPCVKANPTIAVTDVIDHINQGYGFVLRYWEAWRGVEGARDEIFGSYDESYDQLRWYCDAVRRTNPGSILDLEQNESSNRFERIFVSFNACREGFKSCRPMLFIDGTFMKGRSKGVLLAATAKDGNNGLFPVAFAVVSSENRNNWAWFLTKLRDLISHPKKIIYISDRNVGLMSAFYDVWSDPAHFYCLYHLLANLRGRYGGGWNTQHRENMAELFKQCAYAPTISIFNENLKKFKEVGGKIAEVWLQDLPCKRWAVSHSPHLKRYGEMTSNAAESFNSWIREARALPITYMIDSIRKQISNWFVERRAKSNTWSGLLVPSKEQLWNELANISGSWRVNVYPNGQYEVLSKPSVTVDLDYNICTCFLWQIKGFPCAHAVAVIKKHCNSVNEYVEDCFTTDTYKKCYKEDLIPVPETERFESSVCQNGDKILPPVLNKPPGRPKQKRITSYGEFRKVKSSVCKRCGKSGRHDPLTCGSVFGRDKTNVDK